jgi:hypothetical protein
VLVEFVAVFVGVFGLTCALALTAYLAVFRNAGRPAWPAALVVTGLGVVTATALAMQEFAISSMVFIAVPETVLYADTPHALGPSSAVATIQFAVLAVLGLFAMALLIPTGTQVSLLPRTEGARRPKWPARLGALAGVAILLGLAVVFLAPWASRIGQTASSSRANPAALLADTWLPALPTSAAAIAIAALGGFGIGALRPLGRYSELLLIPFAPWLFAGAGMQYLHFMPNITNDTDFDSFFLRMSPAWLSVPALVLFTLLFRGQAARRITTPAPFARAFVWPGLAVAMVATAVLWIVQAHDALWQRAFIWHKSGLMVFLDQLLPGVRPQAWEDAPFGLVTPPWLAIAVAVAAVLAQWFVLDRVEISAGSRFPDGVVVGEQDALGVQGQYPGGWWPETVVVPRQHDRPVGLSDGQ